MNIREPSPADAVKITELVRRCQPLDENSHYLYLLLCLHFSSTCVIAEREGQVFGFLSAYRPPSDPEVIFVWQVAVDSAARGQGLAGSMLNELLARDACRDVRYLEATIGPSNRASQALFLSLADRLGTECRTRELFPRELFPSGEEHEPEILYRIGPFDPRSTKDGATA